MQIAWVVPADATVSADDKHCGCIVVSAAPANVPIKIPAIRTRQRNRIESFNVCLIRNSSLCCIPIPSSLRVAMSEKNAAVTNVDNNRRRHACSL